MPTYFAACIEVAVSAAGDGFLIDSATGELLGSRDLLPGHRRAG